MKRFIRGVQITNAVAGVALFWWASSVFTARYFKADRFTFHFSGSFCAAQQNAIQDFFQNDTAFKNAPLAQLGVQVQEQFPSIKSLSLQTGANGVIAAHMTSVSPILRITHNLVLADEGRLFKRSLFDGAVTGGLHKLEVPELERLVVKNKTCNTSDPETIGCLADPLFTAAVSISETLFDAYHVSCQDKASWWLQDKEEKNFFILFNGERIPDDKMLAACATMKGTLVDRGQLSAGRKAGRKARSWVADVRFDDQIILFAKPGGR